MPAPTGTVARILGVSRTFTASSAPTRAGHGAGGKRALLQTSIPICVACVREIVNGRHGRSCDESDRRSSVDCLGRSRRSNLRVKAPANGRSWPDWDHDHLYGLAATRERCYGTALRRARVANEAMLRRRDRCCLSYLHCVASLNVTDRTHGAQRQCANTECRSIVMLGVVTM
jgi:hypothetical protein